MELVDRFENNFRNTAVELLHAMSLLDCAWTTGGPAALHWPLVVPLKQQSVHRTRSVW